MNDAALRAPCSESSKGKARLAWPNGVVGSFTYETKGLLAR